MKILIFDTHWQLSTIISPYKFMQHDFSEGCLFSSEKTCDIEWQKPISSKFPTEKLFSENKNWFCQSNLEEQRKSYINP